MRVLAMDATSAFGSLALLEEDILLEEMPLHSPEGFGQVLFGHIQALLDRHGWTINSIDRFAAASGPGSFTGVRIGLTAAKGLAEATGRAVNAVSNLEALSYCGSTPVRAVVMDARRGEVYGAVYDAGLRVRVPEAVAPFREWMDRLPIDVTEIVSPDFSAFRSAFDRDIPVLEKRTLAGAVARIAAMRDGSDPAAIDANYVRRSDAELFWTDR